jgi:outer membrane protein assembly factor BamD (BamD/ComL family)
MNLSAISSSSSLSQSLQTWQAKAQKIQTEFQQLGQDLQAGNLSQAQSDFSTLSKNISGPLQSNGTLSQAFSALSSALSTGGLSAAQQAYNALQQGVQQVGGMGRRPHHHSEGGSESATSSEGSAMSQLFSSLGSALQSGNLSAAQTAYSTLAQDIGGLGSSSGTMSSSLAGALSFLG